MGGASPPRAPAPMALSNFTAKQSQMNKIDVL